MGSSRALPRAYLRHPADIPIEIRAQPILEAAPRRLKDVGMGGLACRSDKALEVGTPVEVSIELVEPPFTAEGRVAWCKRCGAHHEVGIQFTNADDAFAARMVEQVCHIEQYRQDALRCEGRVIDGRTAALEWIDQHAANFPSVSEFKYD
ncbi:MAG: PilZ domain-containing protein [Rhodocyclaceae bacterium]